MSTHIKKNMKFPDFENVYISYVDIYSFNIYRSIDNVLLGTMTRNSKYIYSMIYAPGMETIVSSSPSLSADVFLVIDCINSSDSGDAY